MDDYEPTINTTAFLFGNINKKGQLEADDADLASINKLSNCDLHEIKSTIDSLFSQPDSQNDSLNSSKDNFNYDNVNSVDFYDENEFIEETDFNSLIDTSKVANIYNDEDNYDDCITSVISEDTFSMMPPPSEVPMNIQNKRNNHDKLHYPNQSHYHIDHVMGPNQNENINTLNTPLGSILPPEYANVKIQSLYPHYHPDKIPRFLKMLKALHEPQLYRPLDQWKHDPPENLFIKQNSENENYIYDIYGINLGIMPPEDMIKQNDADLFSLPAKSFADCEFPVPFRDIQLSADNTSLIQTNHISSRSDPANNFQKRNKFQQEMKRKRKREDKLNKFKGNSENPVKKSEVLIGLTWRDGPASYWYDMYNIPIEENILEYRIKPLTVSDDKHTISIIQPDSLKNPDCSFSTWQLVYWEGDVIIDPQSVKNQIMESNKKYACHAGWIPSIKHRNMATFQDAACSEYFGIWPASSTGTLVQRPDVSQWHSIFALENAQMTEADWVSKIIIDPRHPNAQEPYLLELDLNNECIHFDFTNPQQTKEILTSDLNSVYLSISNTSQQQAPEAAGTEAVDASAASQSNADTPNKEKQLKKMKILSKLSEATEAEEKPKEEHVEPTENESITLSQYSDRDTFVVVRDFVEKSSFNLDIVDHDAHDTTDVISPLVKHGIQHSIPAIQLDTIFFPLKLDNQFLRHMHRTRLTDVKNMLTPFVLAPQPVLNIVDSLQKESVEQQNICRAHGSGDLFFMRCISNLSASSDHIILAEYSEEYPPLMMQTGMASRIINYLHGNSNQQVVMPQLPYGELCVTSQIPFLGQLSTNQIFQALENNMFRAPIYPHRLKQTDFLIIVKSNTVCIRRVSDIFLVGQELPLIEVPAPNSKKANTFLKDFLQVQLIRMFLQSQNEPKRIRHDEIKAMFSEQSDSALKKRLKIFAEYKKADTGNNGGFWVLKPEFQLPTEDELIELITPEECCSYYSMMWGLCRLEDAGYNSKSFIQADPEQQDDDEEKESNLKIEDEVKAAPWHTTKTFLDAQKGKCYLELIGATEPSGCGEAFSYARVSTKGSLFKETLKNSSKLSKQPSGAGAAASGAGTSGTHVPGLGKRMVTGTDADLRKLTLQKAYAILKECGIPEHELKKLKRWDIIDLVRQMSTQKANQGEEEAMIKFARSSKMTVAGQEERYRSECQRIFALQNQVLANEDELTSDDGGTDDDNCEENCDDIRKSIYNVFDSHRASTAEEELKQQQKSAALIGCSETNSVADAADVPGKSYSCPATTENARAILKMKSPVPKVVPKALCIRRLVENVEDGTRTTQTQTIPWSSIVKCYFRMNQEHAADYLRTFCGLNQSKEDDKKARRKQQDKMRRLKRQHKQKLHIKMAGGGVGGGVAVHHRRDGSGAGVGAVVKKKYRSKLSTVHQQQKKAAQSVATAESLANINCGACGNKGHMRTNKECPQYGKPGKKAFSKRPLHKRVPGNGVNSGKTISQLLHSDKNPLPLVTAVDGDPSVQEQTVVGDALSEGVHEVGGHGDRYEEDGDDDEEAGNGGQEPLSSMAIGGGDADGDQSSLKLVIPKHLLADAQKARGGGPSNRYRRAGEDRPSLARRQSQGGLKRPAVPRAEPVGARNGNEYVVDQKMRGNRRRIDPRVALNHQFEEIYKGLLQVTGYRCFLHPVRKRECPNYYSVIVHPMDLSTVKMQINQNAYETRESFLRDIKLIYDNCLHFNGETNEYTAIAKQLMSHVMEQFCAKERKLMRLERLVNPLMDEDDMVGMRYILEQAVTAMEEVEHSRPFHTPVDRKRYPDYAARVPRPMDLASLRANIKADRYRSREQFMNDAELILTNCVAYNGVGSLLTAVSQRLIEVAAKVLEERAETMQSLEASLRVAREVEDEDDSSQEDVEEDGDQGPPRKAARTSATVAMASSDEDADRERIMADLQLTDSEEDEPDQDFEEDCDGRQEEAVSPHSDLYSREDEAVPFENKTDLIYYDQHSDHNSEPHGSGGNVTFYISDDD